MTTAQGHRALILDLLKAAPQLRPMEWILRNAQRSGEPLSEQQARTALVYLQDKGFVAVDHSGINEERWRITATGTDAIERGDV